jgi:outer membrane protein assembly factor BamB
VPVLQTPAPTSSDIVIAVPNDLFVSLGSLPIVASNPGCSSSTTLTVRSPASASPLGWPRHHHDNQNTSVSPTMILSRPVVRWRWSLGNEAPGVAAAGGGAWSHPAVTADSERVALGLGAVDVVFQAGVDGTISSYRADGTLRYQFSAIAPSPLGITSAPAVRADGSLYVASSDGNLYALDARGDQRWSYRDGAGSGASAIATEDGMVVSASDDGVTYALDPNGQLLWTTRAPGLVSSAFASTPQTLGSTTPPSLFFCGGQNGWFALSPADGHTVWQVAATGEQGAAMSSPVVSPDGSTVYGIDSGGQVVAIAATSGTVLWRASYPSGGGNTPALLGESLYAVFYDGLLRSISTRDGNERWRRDIHNSLQSPSGQLPTPSIDGCGLVWVYSDDGNLYSFGLGGGAMPPLQLTPARTQFIVPQVAIGADQAVYVAGTDDRLYALY